MLHTSHTNGEVHSSRAEIVGPQPNAVENILEIATLRAQAHFGTNLIHYGLTAVKPEQRIEEAEYHQQLTATRGLTDLFDVFAGNPSANSLDLAFIVNNGHWNRERLHHVEVEIREIAERSSWGATTSGYLESSYPHSRRRIWLQPGFVKEKGKIAMRRKRNLFNTRPQPVELFDTQKESIVTRWQRFSIDKVSEFALDGHLLSLLPLESSVYGEMKAISDGKIVGELKHPDGLAILEEVINQQLSELLSPADTVYYAHQEYFTEEEMAGQGMLARYALKASMVH